MTGRQSAVHEEEIALATKSSDARVRAESSFKKEERAKDGAKAMMEYIANSQAIRERTERLKALRLAQEDAKEKNAKESAKESVVKAPKKAKSRSS
jgi:hypothetical protein